MTTELHEAVDPRRIVADGYDAIAERYFAWSDARPSATRLRVARAGRSSGSPPGADVLDLGCGAGRADDSGPGATGRRVTGVDISVAQIELARAAVPGARFIHADMTALDLPPASLDAVVAFYSLTHVPRADLPGLLAAIHRWLRPGGVLVATMGAQDSPDAVEARLAGRHDVLQPLRGEEEPRARPAGRVRDRAGGRRGGARGPPRRPSSCGSSPASRAEPDPHA